MKQIHVLSNKVHDLTLMYMWLSAAEMRMLLRSFPCLHTLTLYDVSAGDDAQNDAEDDPQTDTADDPQTNTEDDTADGDEDDTHQGKSRDVAVVRGTTRHMYRLSLLVTLYRGVLHKLKT